MVGQTMLLKYYNVYGDSDDTCFYYDKEAKVKLEYCPQCGKITNRKEAILQACQFYRRKHKRLLYVTWDGVSIASQRFVEIYNQYKMNGLSFFALPKSPGSCLVRCENIIRHDCDNANIILEKVCPLCGRRDGAYMPQPY
jgi:hypothetical protein